MLSSVEELAEKEAKQSLIDRKLVEAMAQFVEVAVAARTYAALPVHSAALYLAKVVARNNAIFAELRALTVDDPATLADIEQLISIGSTSQKQFLAYKGVSQPDSANDPALAHLDVEAFRSGRVFVSCLKESLKILDRETAKLEGTRAQLKINRLRVRELVWAELLLGIAVIALLYFLFRYDFVRRFNNLLLIARDLAMDKPPSQTIAGGDELTELSKALIDAAQARQEAVAQKQMLFQMVTHDLRSPLMAASIVVETLTNEISGDVEQRRERLNSMQRSLKRVVGLTDDLLTIEQHSAGGLELRKVQVDFKETIKHAIEIVQPLADRKDCQIVNQSPSLLVSVDEDRILQVLVNLLANAIKFSQPASPIEVTTALDAGRLHVEVLDRGAGISEEDIQQLFNPFKQSVNNRNSAGFGLGLAIAKMLVDLHDGEIGARPRTGGGTVFWFTLALPEP